MSTTTTTKSPALDEVRDGIVRAFEEAHAVGDATAEPKPEATPQGSARLLDAAFERFERAHGLNVVPFPEWASRTAE